MSALNWFVEAEMAHDVDTVAVGRILPQAGEEQRIGAAVSEFRGLRRRLDPPPAVYDHAWLRRALVLLDEIQALCSRCLRRTGVKPRRHWAANLLLEAVHERNRLELVIASLPLAEPCLKEELR